MSKKDNSFSEILASSIHDVKNSIGVLLNSLEMMMDAAGDNKTHSCPTEELSQLEYQTKRISNNLVQLLAIYRIDNENYEPYLQQQSVSEFVDDCITLNAPLLKGRSITIDYECDDSLDWSFDTNLVTGIVNNTIVNSSRYTNGKILISASVENGFLRIDIDDNGRGYPDMMLDYGNHKTEIDFTTGSTGLGIHFIDISTKLHNNGKDSGYMKLANDGRLGGGVLSIFLPPL
ncbi:MAG: HAMP domain-containing histidine kinase [Chromatiales bacterium]|nr:HAMP domain-containing histidine kinase [Chromatiales bacterium]